LNDLGLLTYHSIQEKSESSPMTEIGEMMGLAALQLRNKSLIQEWQYPDMMQC
jgi:hypothetical protein